MCVGGEKSRQINDANIFMYTQENTNWIYVITNTLQDQTFWQFVPATY